MDELAEGRDGVRLPGLQVADEVPAETVAELLVLGLEVLQAVLADDGHARLGEKLHLLRGDVLRRHDDGDALPDFALHALVVRADGLSGYRQ
jgi:hypothetical protein